jgi:DNA-binding NarL/FixJ family response regulator
MTQSDAQAIRVFLIDDHPTVVWGLERLIESGQSGMRVVGKASDTERARRALAQVEADVIVLDLDLGEENGGQAIDELIDKSGARILVLTGVRDCRAHESAIRSGALGVIGKDADPAEILLAIQRVARGELAVDRVISERLIASFAGGPAQARSAEEKRMDALTSREREIVQALMRSPERPLKEIARSLSISERTLRNHLSAVYDKLGVSGRLELYAFTSKTDPDKLTR